MISTGDKDMAQLVDGRITLVNTMTDSRLDRAGVKAKFDVYPEQIVDYLALVGDSSDNIPGVPKVGAKTAAKWLNQYSTLDALLAHRDEIEGKVGESLREHLNDVTLSRQLATIRGDLDLPVQPHELTRGEPDVARLRDVYGRLELRSLLRQLPARKMARSHFRCAPMHARRALYRWSRYGRKSMTWRRPTPPTTGSEPISGRYETVLTEAALEEWLERLRGAPLMAFDIETTSLDYMRAEIVGVSLCCEPGHAAYVPLAHDYAGRARAARPGARARGFEAPARGSDAPQGRDTISSSTRMSCATTASSSPACATTRCSSPTCSTAPPHGTTSTRPRRVTSGSRRSGSRTSRAGGRSS